MKFASIACLLFFGTPTMVRADDFHVPPPNPRQPVDYVKWLNETLAPPAADNAAPLLQQIDENLLGYSVWTSLQPAAQSKGSVAGEADYEIEARNIRAPWKADQYPRFQEYLKANARNLDLTRRASQKPAYFAPLAPAEDWTEFVNLLPAIKQRGIAKLLLAEGWGGVGAGRPELLVEDALTVLRFARQLDSAPFLIDRLVSLAMGSMAYDSLIGVLVHVPSPGAFARTHMASIAAADPSWPSLARSAGAEKVFLYHYLQQIFAWDDQAKRYAVVDGKVTELARHYRRIQDFSAAMGGAKIDLTDKSDVALSVLAKWKLLTYDVSLEAVDRLYAGIVTWMELPWQEALVRERETIDHLKKNGHLLTADFGPEAFRCRHLCEKLVAKQRATRLIYVIWAHHQEKGAFPPSLGRLQVPGDSAIRIDPFSGQNFVYKLTADGFILYSVSTDRDDDGGKHDPRWGQKFLESKPVKSGDYLFWPPQADEKL